MTRPMDSLKLFATLLVFWILLNGSVAPGTLAVGLAVAAVIAWAFRDTLSVLSGHKLTLPALWATLRFVGYFLKELVKANLQMAAIVLNPRLPIAPAIVGAEVRLKHPVARLLLANAITLTPGTLTLEVRRDPLTLYVHALDTRDIDQVQRDVRTLEVLAVRAFGDADAIAGLTTDDTTAWRAE